MDNIFYEIFKSLPRQGPGDTASTKKAFRMLDGLSDSPSILDIGCGSGRQTLVLAGFTKGKITALDNHPPFINRLNSEAKLTGLSARVKGIVGDMGNIKLAKGSFDVIWSEGAIFIIGFLRALNEWREFLKPEGFLVISELVWFKKRQPAEINNFFNEVYPEIKYYQDILPIIESSGYKIIGSFPIPDESWHEDYYIPAQLKIAELQKKYPKNKVAKEIFNSFLLEIDMFRKYSKYYGYYFYVMQKTNK
jgi:SAM-dependent methyltransferase